MNARPMCSFQKAGELSAWAGCLLLIQSFSATAQESSPGIAEWPYSAVGRVNVIKGAGRRSQCTGTLVGPRHVLTAAHCLFNQERGLWVHPTSVHFVAGYQRGEFRGHAKAQSYRTGPQLSFVGPPQLDTVALDWALIELAAPMDLKPVQVSTAGSTSSPTQVVRAGYRGDRSHVLNVQPACTATPIAQPAPLLVHSCSAVQGESGSALLGVEEGEPRIVGVVVAGAKQDPTAPSLAVPSSTFASIVGETLRQAR